MNEGKNIHFMLYKADTPRLRGTTENICYLITALSRFPLLF